MKHTIRKRFEFSASHRLDHLPAGHQCARLHGHNYSVEVELSSDSLNADGFVRDYGDLRELKEFIDTRFDHRHLNDVLGSGIATTAENLAKYLFDFCHAYWTETTAVRVSETPKTVAEYRA